MSPAYLLTPRAIDDLDSIWAYIAQDNAAAADRVEAAIFTACERLARYPLLGSRRPDVTPHALRFWPVSRFPNYVIVYRPESKPLQVVAVLHRRRDTGRIMAERQHGKS